MAMVKEALERCSAQENLVGSRLSLNLYKSLFKSSDLDEWGVLADLEAGWTDYAREQHELLDLEGDRERYQGDAIGSFISNLEQGFIPPPETLLALYDALSHYLMCNGSMSLDQALLGVPHVKNSSYAMAKGTNAGRMSAFSTLMGIEKQRKKPPTQMQVAEDFLADSDDAEIDHESFLRSWRRWRNAVKKWAD